MRAEAAAQLAEPGFVALLTELLQRTLESSHARETDREMRNELVVLGTLLLQVRVRAYPNPNPNPNPKP